jgi:hypothetical protein
MGKFLKPCGENRSDALFSDENISDIELGMSLES